MSFTEIESKANTLSGQEVRRIEVILLPEISAKCTFTLTCANHVRTLDKESYGVHALVVGGNEGITSEVLHGSLSIFH